MEVSTVAELSVSARAATAVGGGADVAGAVAVTDAGASDTTPQDERAAREVALRVFAAVSTKWGLRVLEQIGDGTARFRALHRELDGISYRMLTRTLRELEDNGLVDRHDHRTANPRVDYRLTDAGLRLLGTVHGLCRWSRENLDSLLEAPAHRSP